MNTRSVAGMAESLVLTPPGPDGSKVQMVAPPGAGRATSPVVIHPSTGSIMSLVIAALDVSGVDAESLVIG